MPTARICGGIRRAKLVNVTPVRKRPRLALTGGAQRQGRQAPERSEHTVGSANTSFRSENWKALAAQGLFNRQGNCGVQRARVLPGGSRHLHRDRARRRALSLSAAIIAERSRFPSERGALRRRALHKLFLIAKDVGESHAIVHCAAMEAPPAKRNTMLDPLIGILGRPARRNARRRRSPLRSREQPPERAAMKETCKSDRSILIALFREADRHDLAIHPDASQACHALAQADPRPPPAPGFAAPMRVSRLPTSHNKPESVWRRTNRRAGPFHPRIRRIVAKIHFHMYHHYT